MSDDGVPAALTQRLRAARHVVVLTGAGVSAESGVPTFRDAQTGLWARYRAEDLATPEAFARDPDLVWQWYAWRRQLVAQAQPNAGHRALEQLEQRAARFTLITQNVDGLHQRAGSRSVIELHGSLQRVKCAREGRILEEWSEEGRAPRCGHCGAHLRPDVVWFGEALPADALRAAQTAAQECDLLMSIGTSACVFPAAELPLIAARAGACVVEINPNATALSAQADFVLAGASGEVLPRLLAELERAG